MPPADRRGCVSIRRGVKIVNFRARRPARGVRESAGRGTRGMIADGAAVPDADGWVPWTMTPRGEFNDVLGQMYFRAAADGTLASRVDTTALHANALGFLHGGFLMSFVDVAMFAILRPRFDAGEIQGAVTLSCATDFLAGGRPGEPIEAHGELLKETGKLFFVRGLVTQAGENICAFTGTLRKVTRSPPA